MGYEGVVKGRGRKMREEGIFLEGVCKEKVWGGRLLGEGLGYEIG